MKKNVKKIKTLSKSPKKKRNREEIRYLGFVVSSELPSSTLTHALVNLKQSPNTWYVAELNADSYQLNTKDSAGRYFRTAFCVAVKAWLRYKSEGKLEKRTVIVEKNKIGDRLRDWARKDKVKSASQDFPKVRIAIQDSLFAASGTRRPLNVVWKGKTKPDAIFFWTPKRLHDAGFKSKDDQPFRTVTIKELSPKSEWAPKDLEELAESLVIEEYGYSWQNLYRKALIKSIRVDNFIELKAHRHRTSEKDYSQALNGLASSTSITEKTVKVLRILQENQKVVLSGPSGSGKTTTLQHMAWQFATKMQNIRGRQVLPLFVPMKWFGIWPQNTENLPRLSEYLAFWIRETIDSNLTVSEIKKCDLFNKRTRHGPTYPSRKDMLYTIRQVAENFFSDEASDYSNIVLLLDGLNEVPEGIRQTVETQLAQLLKCVNRIVITTRSHRISSTPGSVTKFELCELSGEQIAEYLGRILKDGEHIFATQIQNDARILPLARNPFYLSLIVERIKEDPNFSIPENRALLIKDFIHRAVKRKRKETMSLPDHVKDNLLFIVLPRVAKWSIESITGAKVAETIPFYQSQEFQDIQDNSLNIFEALKIGEKYGLLKSSGLPAMSRERVEHPEFIHDNFRDYFAALYLRSLSSSNFIQTLADRFEYFAWDEPLLQFLELNSDEQLFRDIIEFIIPRDVILAAMCIRHVRVLEHSLCLDLESKIRNSAIYKRMAPLFNDDFLKKYTRPLIHSLPKSILSRLPIKFLLDMAQDLNNDNRITFWFSAALNITQDYLALLEELWNSLSKEQLADRLMCLYSISKIPTYDAFRIVSNVYKELQKNPKNDPELFKLDIEVFCFLLSSTYSPSLSEVVSEFPFEKSPDEFGKLLKKVKEISSEDLPFLKKLVFGNDIYVSVETCKLLVRSIGQDALPILLNRFKRPIGDQGYKPSPFYYPNLHSPILDLVVDIAPQKAFEILSDLIQTENGYSSDLHSWKALAKIPTKESLTHFVKYLYGNSTLASYFCADQIENWPYKNDILAEFESCLHEHDFVSDRAKLFGAWLGIERYLPQVSPIFNRIYSVTVLGVKTDTGPIDPTLKKYFDISEVEWRKQHNKMEFTWNPALLPMAIRAANDYSNEFIKRLLHIIQWAIESITKINNYEEVFLESIAQTILKLAKLSNLHPKLQAADKFLKSGLFQDLFYFIQKEVRFGGSNKKLRSAFNYFCDSIPKKYVPHLLQLTQELYVESLTRSLSDEKVNLEISFDTILHLCRRATETAVSEFLHFLTSDCIPTVKEGEKDPTLLLIEEIKLAKGKRFVSCFDQDQQHK